MKGSDYMTDKLNHYSLTNPASVYDEEAMTALELAGRTAQKVNECVDEVNKIPDVVDKSVNEYIDKGEFSKDIDRYAGDLSDKVDHLLNDIPEGATSMDLEVVDIRLGFDGREYNDAGTAVRSIPKFGQIGKYYDRTFKIDTVTQYIDCTRTTLLFYGKNRYTVGAFSASYETVGSNAFYVVYDVKDATVKCVPYGSYDGTREIVMLSVNLSALDYDGYAFEPYVGTYYVDNIPHSEGVHESLNVVLADNIVSFDTEQKIVKINNFIYATHGAKTWTIAPSEISYANLTGNRFYVVIKRQYVSSTYTPKVIPVESYHDDYLILFQFQANHIKNPLANNIPCSYSVDGELISRYGGVTGSDGEVVMYVDNERGYDINNGSKFLPFSSIQSAINAGASVIYVAPTDTPYTESIKAGGKSSLKLVAMWEEFTDQTTRPKVIVDGASAVEFTDISSLVLEGFEFRNGVGDGALLTNVNNATVRDCNFHKNGKNGLAFVNSSGSIYGCNADENTNDGFNFHGFGDTHLFNCNASKNLDDGVSHHDGCTGSVNGGSFSENGTTGICPAYGARVNVYNARFVDEKIGVLFYQEKDREVGESIVQNCIFHSCDIGIKSVYQDVIESNNIFYMTTMQTQVGAGNPFTKCKSTVALTFVDDNIEFACGFYAFEGQTWTSLAQSFAIDDELPNMVVNGISYRLGEITVDNDGVWVSVGSYDPDEDYYEAICEGYVCIEFDGYRVKGYDTIIPENYTTVE